MKIALMGFTPETTEDDLREELKQHGVSVDKIQIHPSDDPKRYFAVLDVDTSAAGAKVLAQKINGKIWKGQQLRAEYLLRG